jgi:hypothetical protein
MQTNMIYTCYWNDKDTKEYIAKFTSEQPAKREGLHKMAKCTQIENKIVLPVHVAHENTLNPHIFTL